MALNLLGQYDTSSDSDTPTSDDTPTNNDTPTHTKHTTSIDEQETEGKGRGYFDDDFSGDSDPEDIVEDSSEEDSDTICTKDTAILPLPVLERLHTGVVEVVPGSVFSNTYKEEEDAKLAILKRHVTLGPTEEPPKEIKKRFRRKRREYGNGGRDEEDGSNDRMKNFNKVKVGLSGGLVPSNKYMKLHQKQQANERPWTIDNKR